jgi:deazaflavin-dependent oxidoreductase (nitroreductase family)
MFSDLMFKATNRLHRATLKATGGRVGWKLKGMQVVQLTTTGRRSGEQRTVMLTSPWQEGSTVVVVASRGGDDRPPAWLLNIEASADVQVSLSGGPATPWKARVASAEERARLWPLLTQDHKHYAGYQTKTDREIPLVLLTPA